MEIYELLKNAPSIKHFLTEASFPFGYNVQKIGFIPSYHYVFPERSRNFFDAVISRNLELSEQYHHEIMDFIFRTALPLLNKGYIDGAIDKAYAKLGGMDISLTIKSPYQPLSVHDYEWLTKETLKFEQDLVS